jgi:hypothetical protein
VKISQSGVHDSNVVGDRRIARGKQHGPFKKPPCPTGVASWQAGIAPVVEDYIVFPFQLDGVPVGEIRQIETPQPVVRGRETDPG